MLIRRTSLFSWLNAREKRWVDRIGWEIFSGGGVGSLYMRTCVLVVDLKTLVEGHESTLVYRT